MRPDAVYEVIDLFAGPGGWDEGMRQIGVTNILGIEYEKNACATAELAGHERLAADIAAIDPRSVAEPVVGLIGSPPCPGFSAAGSGLGRQDFELLLWAISVISNGADVDETLSAVRAQQNDPRSALTLEPLRWALALDPEWIALEQVPPVLPLWEAIAVVLRLRGYNVWTGNLQAEQYGVPQTRKRAALLASKVTEVDRPLPTHSRYYPRSPTKLDQGVRKWVSMAEALGRGMTHRPSMTVTGGGAATGGAEPFGNAARQGMLREMEAGRWELASRRDSPSWIEENGTRENRLGDRPAPTITGEAHRWAWQLRSPQTIAGGERAVRSSDEPSVTVTSNFDRAMWQPTAAIEGENSANITWPFDRPSPTIVGSYHPEVVAAPGYRKPGDPPRQKTPGSVRVTVEEAGILQSFPADYPWQGKQGKQFQQVGNAVPPLLAAHIGQALGLGTLIQEQAA